MADIKAKHGKLLKERLDLTAYLKWFIVNYPDSRGKLANIKLDITDF